MIVILLLTGLFLFLVYKLVHEEHRLDALPGPKPWPLIGNVHQLDKSKFFLCLSDLAKQYGGIFRIKLFTKSVVVVSDLRFINEVLIKQSAVFSGRQQSYRTKIILERLGGIILNDPGPELSGRRKAVQIFLKQFGSGIKRIEEVTQTPTDDLITRFSEQQGRPIPVRDFLFRSVLDVTAVLLLGDTIDESEIQGIKNILDTLDEAVSASSGIVLDTFPFVRYLGNKTYRQLQEIIAMKDKLVADWMERKPVEGFISFLESMPQEEQVQRCLNSSRVRGNVAFEFLVGGVFATTQTLTCLMNVLCQHPDIQKKLQMEVLDVIGPSRHATMKDQDCMPYLRATLLEIGRYLSVSPLSVPHKAVQTGTLDRYTIPKDTEIFVNLWSLHHDEKLWDEPFRFRPERFLDADGQLVAADHPNRRHVMAFSAGQRVCVGEVFALSRMFLITARILQNFSILPESTVEKQVSCDPRDMTMGLVLIPPPFKVRMVPLDE